MSMSSVSGLISFPGSALNSENLILALPTRSVLASQPLLIDIFTVLNTLR